MPASTDEDARSSLARGWLASGGLDQRQNSKTSGSRCAVRATCGAVATLERTQGRRGRAESADAPLACAGGEISGLGLAPALAFGDSIPSVRFYPGKYKVAPPTRPPGRAGPTELIDLFDFCCGRQRRASGAGLAGVVPRRGRRRSGRLSRRVSTNECPAGPLELQCVPCSNISTWAYSLRPILTYGDSR